jgi:hypothetical protein
MENRKRVTEEDLLITEALIAQSYGQLKQSVIQAPSRALKSAEITARQNPLATAGVAIVAGVALYGIFKMVTSNPSPHGAPGGGRSGLKKEAGHTDLLQKMLPMLIPLVIPYIGGYIQKYLGNIYSGERD